MTKVVGKRRTARLLLEKDGFLLASHVLVDGDGLGSLLAVQIVLERLGKRVVAVVEGEIPGAYAFLPGLEKLKSWKEVSGPLEVAVFLDCPNVCRAGEGALEWLPHVRETVNIDHHISNGMFGDYNFVDTEAAATGEMLVGVFRSMGVALGPDVATCLYTALVADTGSFRYENTSARTHRVAAELLALGARHDEVARHMFESKSASHMKLLGAALATLRLSPCGRVAWLVITGEMLAQSGASEADAEGIVNYAKDIEGVQIGILFRVMKDGVKVGFRSKMGVDVNTLAEFFGGGGHARAAGCFLEKVSVREALARVVSKSMELARWVPGGGKGAGDVAAPVVGCCHGAPGRWRAWTESSTS